MKAKFRIKLDMPADADKDAPTHIDFSFFKSDRKMLVFSGHPVTERPDGTISMMLFAPGSFSNNIEPMARLNKNRIDTVATVAKQQIRDKSGPFYDMLVKALAEMKRTATGDITE